MKSQHDEVKSICHSSELKTERNFSNSFMKAIFAGIFISLGALGNIVISADTYATNPGVAKFLGAVVFPVGLMSIVILGLELFTSNCMNILGVAHKKVSLYRFIRNLIIVYIGNFVGCIIFAYISYRSHSLSTSGVALLKSFAHHKVETDMLALILKGIMCNVLVVGATMISYYSSSLIGKIFGIWFPIMLFILLGYSHSVANMFYLSYAYMNNAGITYAQIGYNLFFVTIGNIIGGFALVFLVNIDRNLK